MFIQSTLTNTRPGGKGKGQSNTQRPAQELPRTQINRSQREPSPSRTEELCPEDWLEEDQEMNELDEIIRLMDQRAKEIGEVE